jgi:hypothetical protein
VIAFYFGTQAERSKATSDVKEQAPNA